MTPEKQDNEASIKNLRKIFNTSLTPKQINRRFSRNVSKAIINSLVAAILFVPTYYYLIRPVSINLADNMIERHNVTCTQNEKVERLKHQTIVNSCLIKPIDSVVFDWMALLSISLPLLFISFWHDLNKYEEE